MQAGEIGTFNYAHSFFVAAKLLWSAEEKERSTHPESPIEFLFWHAIELFLKAYLMSAGDDPDTVRKRFGHRVHQLALEAKERGLSLEQRDLDVIAFMPAQEDMIELRYLTLGIKTVPDLEEVEDACGRIYFLVGRELQIRGVLMGFHAGNLGLTSA